MLRRRVLRTEDFLPKRFLLLFRLFQSNLVIPYYLWGVIQLCVLRIQRVFPREDKRGAPSYLTQSLPRLDRGLVERVVFIVGCNGSKVLLGFMMSVVGCGGVSFGHGGGCFKMCDASNHSPDSHSSRLSTHQHPPKPRLLRFHHARHSYDSKHSPTAFTIYSRSTTERMPSLSPLLPSLAGCVFEARRRMSRESRSANL